MSDTTIDGKSSERFALDTEAFEVVRSVHRVVRAMHDGECPACHRLFLSLDMVESASITEGETCPDCGFSISAKEIESAMALFAPIMDRNLDVFEKWRASLTDPRPKLIVSPLPGGFYVTNVERDLYFLLAARHRTDQGGNPTDIEYHEDTFDKNLDSHNDVEFRIGDYRVHIQRDRNRTVSQNA